MIEPLSFVTAFFLGLLGASHCLVMCGGIAAATSMSTSGQKKHTSLIAFNVGRILSYSIAGFIVSLAGFWLIDSHQSIQLILRTIAGAFLILMALYVSRVWMLLTRFESLGQHLWKIIQPYTRKLLPITSPVQALKLGLLWGWLPCGLIYSTLAWVAAQGSPVQGSLAMFCFGLGTLPGMISAGLLSQQFNKLIQHSAFKAIAGILLALYGVWTILAAWGLLDF